MNRIRPTSKHWEALIHCLSRPWVATIGAVGLLSVFVLLTRHPHEGAQSFVESAKQPLLPEIPLLTQVRELPSQRAIDEPSFPGSELLHLVREEIVEGRKVLRIQAVANGPELLIDAITGVVLRERKAEQPTSVNPGEPSKDKDSSVD